MKPKTEAQYKEWIKEVESSLVDEASKKAFQALTSNADEGLKVFGGYLRQTEFDRLQNDLNAKVKAVEADREAIRAAVDEFKGDVSRAEAWWKQEQPKNAQLGAAYNALAAQHQEAIKLLKELGLEDSIPKAAPINSPAPGGVDAAIAAEVARIKEYLNLQNQQYPRIMGDLAVVVREGIKDGFDFDPSAVIAYASRSGVDLKTAYKSLTAEQREAKEKADLEKRLEEAKEAGRREALSKIPSPERIRAAGPTVFDHLDATPNPVDRRDRVAGAVKEFIDTGGAAVA